MVDAARSLASEAATTHLVVGILSILIAAAGGYFALSRVSVTYRARNRVELIMLATLIVCSTIAILTTVGIVGSMLSETIRFFAVVPPTNFFFGTVWDPRFSTDGSSVGQFGLIPLLLGTLYIAIVAMLIAVPIGLFAAIYMAEYASRTFRSIVKPLLEILAGIPTIVYGFFALVTVGPFLRDFSADLWGAVTGDYVNFIQAQSVLTAGLVMSIRLIPFVSSLSDDIITAVPRAMRDGSLGLGATRSETMKRVILPAALPGIMGALLLTGSRAIGETMIVVLAAGVAANLQFSPFEPMTTITVKIVNQLTGDLEFNSPQTLVAFALGITLFVITLLLNIYALYIVRKYREQYE
jgi:phosphate transport system permease protein